MQFEYIWKFVRQNECARVCKVPDDVLCTICGKIMVNAHIGSCGCGYCLECITDYLNGAIKICPRNTEDCQDELIDINRNVLPDFASHRKILKLIVKCPRDWCEFTDELRRIEAHERMCKRQTVHCPYCSIGCQETQSLKAKIDEHLMEENESHAKLLIEFLGVLHNEIGLVKSDVQSLRGEKKEPEVTDESQVGKIEITNQEIQAAEEGNISIKGETAFSGEFRVGHFGLLTSIEQQLLAMQTQGQTQATEIKDLIKENKSIIEENASIKIENQSINDQIKSINDQITSTRDENITMKVENQSIKNEIESTKEELEIFRTEHSTSATAMTLELSEMRTQGQAMANEMEYLRGQIESIKEENALIKDERRSMKDQWDKSQAEYGETLASVKRDLSEMRTRGLAQAKEMECSNHEIELLKTESKSIKEENESIKKLNQSIKDEFASFRTEYIELYALIEHQLSEMKTQAQVQKGEFESLNQEIRVVKSENQSILEEIILIKENNKSIKIEIESMKDNNKVLTEENQRIKEENQSMRKDIGLMHDEFNDFNVDYAEFLGAIEKHLPKRRILGQVRNREISRSSTKNSYDGPQMENERGNLISAQMELDKEGVCEDDAMRVWQRDINNSLGSKGECVWSIDHWASWTGSTQAGKSKHIFSDPFYSHEKGYKMCLSAITHKGYLCVQWHLMHGNFDNKLQWPFVGSVILSIINQHTMQVHTSYRETSDGTPDYRWNKPKGERNDGFGKPCWVRVSDICQNREVCNADRIFIRCVVTNKIRN